MCRVSKSIHTNNNYTLKNIINSTELHSQSYSLFNKNEEFHLSSFQSFECSISRPR